MQKGRHLGKNSDTWRGVIGQHSLLDLNQSNVLLLEFCASHSITNTMLKHKNVQTLGILSDGGKKYVKDLLNPADTPSIEEAEAEDSDSSIPSGGH